MGSSLLCAGIFVLSIGTITVLNMNVEDTAPVIKSVPDAAPPAEPKHEPEEIWYDWEEVIT